jgi:hypothetical protein
MGVLPGLFFLLLLLVTITPVVHELHHRRAGLLGDLHHVQLGFGGHLSGFVQGDDSDLLSLGVDEADGADADLFVYAWLFDEVLSCWGYEKEAGILPPPG